MQEPFFECENRATRESPYVDGGRKNLAARAHIHEELEVVCVLSGTVEATVDGVLRTLSEGDLCIVMPGEVHSYFTRKESRSHVMKLYAAHELLSLRIGGAGKITREHPHYADFRAAIDAIVTESRERSAGYAYAVLAAVNLFTMGIYRYLAPVRVSEREQKEIRMHSRFLEEFDRFLAARYKEPISLDLAAAEMHYSRYYFAHRFTEITGQTFLDYVTLFRLERARTALENGKSVLDTALECGFGSVRSFHRAFKKHYGISPAVIKGNKTGTS